MNLLPKDSGDLERETKSGSVLAVFDVVDALPRDTKVGGELGLCPLFFGAKDAETSFHGRAKPTVQPEKDAV